MKFTDTFKLGHIRHVIPLNENVKCSELTFTATSTDGCNFEAVVIKTSDLNSDASFEFNSSVNGMLSGTLIVDDPLGDEEYTLLLRSENPCECIVEIQIENEHITKKKPRLNSKPTSKPKDDVANIEKYDSSVAESPANTGVFAKIDYGKIMMFLGFLVLCYVLYRCFCRSSDSKDKDQSKQPTNVPVLKDTIVDTEQMHRRLRELNKTNYNSSGGSSNE
jgi:hypothetical protein